MKLPKFIKVIAAIVGPTLLGLAVIVAVLFTIFNYWTYLALGVVFLLIGFTCWLIGFTIIDEIKKRTKH